MEAEDGGMRQVRTWVVAGLLAVFGATSCGDPAATSPEAEADSDPADLTGRWTEGPPMPQGRMRHASVVYRGDLYVAGGIVSAGQATASVIRLRPGSDEWTEVAPLPYEWAGLSLVVLADTLLAVGGDGPPFGAGDKLMLAYDPSADSWSVHSTVPDARLEAEAVTFLDEVWVTGGTVRRDGYHFPDIPGELLMQYRPALGGWRYGDSIPNPRLDHEAVVAGGEVYLIGGRVPNEVNRNAQMDRFDGSVWSTVADSFATHRLAATHVAPLIHVVGGTSTLDWHRVFDPRTQSWDRLPGLPHRLEWPQLIGWEGALWIIGGLEVPEGGPTEIQSRVMRLALQDLGRGM